MSHTPGPWIGIKNKGVKTADGKTVFETGCRCCTEPDLSENDARLIAATPDLASALRDLVNLADISQPFEVSQAELVWNAARAALAKASV